METFQVVNKMNPSIPHLNVDTLDGNFRYLSSMFAEDKGFNGTEEELSDTESDSFNSTKTDRTFDPNSLDVSFSEDLGKSDTNRETTPTNQATDGLDMAMEALTSSLVHSTPAKKNITNRQRMPTTSASNTSRYNLRSQNRSSSTMDCTLEETPETFSKLVKEQLCRSKRNHSKLKMAVGRQREEYCE